MSNERVVEIPWLFQNIPQKGLILDIGSCEAVYLDAIPQHDRILHCIDIRECYKNIPTHALFFQESIIGNSLIPYRYDAVVVISTLEHIGLPYYEQDPFQYGDILALAEIKRLLKPGKTALITVPAGRSKITHWYRQYSPDDLKRLFKNWDTNISYWGSKGSQYVTIEIDDVSSFDYIDSMIPETQKAGAVACIIARS
jgi:hypothetical protein